MQDKSIIFLTVIMLISPTDMDDLSATIMSIPGPISPALENEALWRKDVFCFLYQMSTVQLNYSFNRDWLQPHASNFLSENTIQIEINLCMLRGPSISFSFWSVNSNVSFWWVAHKR